MRAKEVINNDKWNKKVGTGKFDSDTICQHMSTYEAFLERNIMALMSNASCIPNTQLKEIVPTDSSKARNEIVRKRLDILIKNM